MKKLLIKVNINLEFGDLKIYVTLIHNVTKVFMKFVLTVDA